MALKPGTWWVKSESNPEWNGEGHADLVGGFVIPDEAKEWIERKRKELKAMGPPPDLEWGYEKD